MVGDDAERRLLERRLEQLDTDWETGTRMAASEEQTAECRKQLILAAIRSIPEGFVSTYGDVSPRAPRLAGAILAGEEAADLPWWRVVRSDGSLAVGEEQRARLDAEGVPFLAGAPPRVDLALAWFAVDHESTPD